MRGESFTESHRSAMQFVQDSFQPGSVVAACLSPGTLGELEPVLRRLLSGKQLFVKQPDGSYRPKGSPLGLAQSHCFQFADLELPALATAGPTGRALRAANDADGAARRSVVQAL